MSKQIKRDLTRPRFIRFFIFKMTQVEFAEIVGVPQSVVSKWEAEDRFTSYEQMAKIRDAATRIGIKWRDSYFFEVPPHHVEKRQNRPS